MLAMAKRVGLDRLTVNTFSLPFSAILVYRNEYIIYELKKQCHYDYALIICHQKHLTRLTCSILAEIYLALRICHEIKM